MAQYPVVVKLLSLAPLWEPKSNTNFWKVGDVSRPLDEGTDFSAIKKYVKEGRMAVVQGSLDDEPKKETKKTTTKTKKTKEEPKVEVETPKEETQTPEEELETKKTTKKSTSKKKK